MINLNATKEDINTTKIKLLEHKIDQLSKVLSNPKTMDNLMVLYDDMDNYLSIYVGRWYWPKLVLLIRIPEVEAMAEKVYELLNKGDNAGLLRFLMFMINKEIEILKEKE